MDKELEKKLIEKVEKSNYSREAVDELLDFYKRSISKDFIPLLVNTLIGESEDIEEKAHCCLVLGLEMEDIADFDRAILYYAYGLGLVPKTAYILYFLNNNVGYSLIMLGRYEEAKEYCETAMRLNPNRFNAYKNLGLSLQGLGKYAEAAKNFMKAVQMCHAIDQRAYNHLEDLLLHHPELMNEIDGIEEFLIHYGQTEQDRVLH